MKIRREVAVAVMALTMMIAICAARSARQQSSDERTQSTPKTAPEMDRLKFYLGEWDYTETYPKGGKNTGVYTSKLGPGGNSLVNGFHSKGPVGNKTIAF